MKRITLFVLLLFMVSNSFTQNIVVNPGFEIWENANKPTGWLTAQNCLQESVSFNSGAYSCQHTGGTSATKYLGQTLAVTPGKQYSFSFFYKTIITGTGNGSRIWCYWKDTGGNSVQDPSTDDILRPSKYLKSETWQQFNVAVTAPQTAVAFYLEVRTYPNSIAYWDDFVFEESLPAYQGEEKVPEMIIYPNPAYDYLNISHIKNIKHIDILDLTGRKIWESDYSGEPSVRIPVSGLTDGLYIIHICTSDKLIIRKFIRRGNLVQ